MRREIRSALAYLPDDLSRIVQRYSISAGKLLEEYVMTGYPYNYSRNLHEAPQLSLTVIDIRSSNLPSLRISIPYITSIWIDDVYGHDDLIGALQRLELPEPVQIITNMLDTFLNADI